MAKRSVSKSVDQTISELLIIGDIFLYPEDNNELMLAMIDIGQLVFKSQGARALWEPIAKFYKEYGHLPVDDVTFDAILNDKLKLLLEQAIEEAVKPFEDAEHFKSEFMKSVMTVKLKHAVMALENDITPNSLGVVDSEGALARALLNLDQVSHVSSKLTSKRNFASSLDVGITIADNFALREQGERIPIPIEGLAMSNSFVTPGSFRGDMNMIVAPAGMGKTTLLSALAADYAKCFGNVLYVTLETSITPILFKMLSYLTHGVIGAHDYLKTRDDTKGRRLFDTYPHEAAKAIRSLPYTISFMDFTCGESLNADTISRKIQQLKKFNGIDIDIVVVDYLDLMQSKKATSIASGSSSSDGGAANLADMGFQYQLLVADELRMMAQQSNVVVWTATQAGKASRVEESELAKFKPLGQKDIWGSDGKMQFSSIVFGFSLVKLDHGVAVGVMSKIKDRHSIGNMAQYYKAVMDYRIAKLSLYPLGLADRMNTSWSDMLNAWVKEESKKADAVEVAQRRTITKIDTKNLFSSTD